VADSWPSKTLQNIFRKLECYYKTWILKLKINKCKMILFRLSLVSYANRNIRNNYKTFQMKSTLKDNFILLHKTIPYKNIIIYLENNFDKRLHSTKNINIQFRKANQILVHFKRLFYFKSLNIQKLK